METRYTKTWMYRRGLLAYDTFHDVYAEPRVNKSNLVSNAAASSVLAAGTNPRSTSLRVVSGLAFHPREDRKNMTDKRVDMSPSQGLTSCGQRPSNAHKCLLDAIGSSTASAQECRQSFLVAVRPKPETIRRLSNTANNAWSLIIRVNMSGGRITAVHRDRCPPPITCWMRKRRVRQLAKPR